MSKQIVSAFLALHGSIDAQYVSTRKDDKDVDIYEFEIGCQDLPKHTRLYMPNILGKLYYANPLTTLKFIQGKIGEWKKRFTPVPLPDAKRDRSRSPPPGQSSFSDFIAGALTRFEEDETKSMFKLMEQCDREDLRGYMLGHKMPIEHKQERRKLSKAAIQKTGIKWNELDCYIPGKHYNLTGDPGHPGECILVVIEKINSDGTRTINIETIRSITGRMNLAEVEKRLRILLKLTLRATDEIYFFDFACNTFNFLDSHKKSHPEIDQYWPNLLAYQRNDDGSATIIHGTISKAQCERQKIAEQIGEKGVGLGDESESQLYLPDSLGDSSQTSVASLPEKATPLLHVKVPIGAIPSIDFGSVVFEAGPASAAVAASGGVAADKGGKRKHTKRKRSLKRSNRKRRVTRRRYNKKNGR